MDGPTNEAQVRGTGRHQMDGWEWTLDPQVLGSSPRGGTTAKALVSRTGQGLSRFST
jgi:hypothetical protein